VCFGIVAYYYFRYIYPASGVTCICCITDKKTTLLQIWQMELFASQSDK